MEQKGINTVIEETKDEIVSLINTKLQGGIPVSVMGLILQNVMYEVRDGINASLKREAQSTLEHKTSDDPVQQ